MVDNQKDRERPLSYYFLKGEISKRFFDTSATIVGLANSFLTITFLSVFHFGLFQLILAFIAILDGLSIKSLNGSISVEMRRYLNSGEKDKAKRIFGEMSVWRIGFAAIMGIAIFTGSEIIARWYGNDVSLLIKIVSPLLLLYALGSLENIFLESVISFAHWSTPAIRELSKLLFIAGLLAFYELNIVSIVVAHVAAEAIAVLAIGIIVFLKKYREVFSIAKACSEYLMFQFLKTHGKWIFLKFGLTRVAKNTMPWFIKFFVNTEAVAFYSLALNLVAFIEGFMPMAGITPLFLLKIGKKEELSFIFKRSIKYVFWLGIIFMFISLLFAPWIILLIFPKYAPAIPLFRVMILALPVYGIYKVLKSLISVLREYKILTMRVLNEALIIPIGSIMFLPPLGVLGAGIVYVVTYLERIWFFYSRLIKKHPEFRVRLKGFFRLDTDDKDIIMKAVRQALISLLRSFGVKNR